VDDTRRLSQTPSDDPASDERLDSWKQIALYMGRGVTTVQRWEQEEQLPIRRLPHAKKGSVFAFKRELDAWRAKRAEIRTSGGPEKEATSAELPGPARSESGRLGLHHKWIRRGLGVGAVVFVGFALVAIDRSMARPRLDAPAGAPLAPTPVANDMASENGPSLSPDGRMVVYSWRRATAPGLYLKPVAGGSARPLALDDPTKFAEASYSKWSPRGDLIAFLVREDNADPDIRELYVVSPQGGRPRHLRSIAGIGLCWAPGGASIAFNDRSASGEPFSIFIMSIENSRWERLTMPPSAVFGDTQCAFSPDGRRLAFSRYVSRGQSDLNVANLDRRENEQHGVDRLTNGLEGITGLVWSPDGQSIVFGSESGLFKISASPGSGETPAPLIGVGVRALSPTFSQPGSGHPVRLAYEHNVRDVNIWRWTTDPGGTTSLKRLVDGSTWWEDEPAVSPDGRRIAFASNRTGTSEIWTADADGSNARQLTFHRGPIVVSPQWSPNGQRLAFSSQVGANRDIYITQADGTRSKRLTWDTSQEDHPSWSRDGRWIYFCSDRGGIAQIWKMSSEGGNPVRVTSGQASQGFESPDGTRFYFVRSPDVPGVWSIPVGGGPETFVLGDVYESFWGMADTGIAFLVTSPTHSPGGPTIRFYDFATASVKVLAQLEVRPNRVLFGFAVARDARSVLWTHLDSTASDVMVVDPWKP